MWPGKQDGKIENDGKHHEDEIPGYDDNEESEQNHPSTKVDDDLIKITMGQKYNGDR